MKTYSYKDLAATPLEELSEDQKERLVTLGKTAELKMHSCL
jgi:hypothetical protein